MAVPKTPMNGLGLMYKDKAAFLIEMLLVEIVDPKNDKHFAFILKLFIEEGIVGEGELADVLLVSRPSINRWTRGKNLPPLSTRRPIYKFLADTIHTKLKT